MIKNPKIYVEELVHHLKNQSECIADKGLKENLIYTINEVTHLLNYNEWRIALENLLDNLYEIDFKVDGITFELMKMAIIHCGLDYKKWNFIEKLRI